MKVTREKPEMTQARPRSTLSGQEDMQANFFKNSFCSQGPVLVPRFYTLCTVNTIFIRMPGFEPELMRLQPGVLYQ